ncbi:MAG: hypothetical protein UV26_C0034G0003 [candidate division WWE3 bacterium GW2011_GWF2_42_42]|uniref:Uncharacterized protein n=1 Tax=candidate division WWE3 bacterium GW2011_GWF2_42_42 TaxID=1619142 RepID=A0A0G1CJZ6_UNCKA|nr:MAG: hypothetical protein UV26_C0034G0003 [candidate division WWE3 bacterium GW2011_GWF2_42_42]
MKLSELERLSLENIGLKLSLIQDHINRLNQEANKLQVDKIGIFKNFAESNSLDVDKMSIDVPTGEVSLIEDKKEV